MQSKFFCKSHNPAQFSSNNICASREGKQFEKNLLCIA